MRAAFIDYSNKEQVFVFIWYSNHCSEVSDLFRLVLFCFVFFAHPQTLDVLLDFFSKILHRTPCVPKYRLQKKNDDVHFRLGP